MTLVRKIGIASLLTWTLAVTLLRAAQYPNDFAEAHWLIDYRFGFVKRGLVGSIVTLVTECLHLHTTEHLIDVLSGAAFLVYCVVLIVVGVRVVQRCAWSTDAVLAVLVFLSSPFIVMSGQLIGYFDNLTIVLAIVSIALLRKGHIWPAAGLQTLSIFIHESTLLICFPVFCLAWLIGNSQRRDDAERRLPAAPLLLPILCFLILAAYQSVFSPHDLATSLTERLSGFEFIQQERNVLVPQALTRTFIEHYQSQHWAWIRSVTSLAMYGLVLPSMLAILFFTIDAHKIRAFSAQLTILAVCLAPQLMHLVAWDTARIWIYSILCAFLVSWVYAESRAMRRNATPAVRLFCLIALGLNVICLTPLMDNETDHFHMRTRLMLYAPMLAAVGILMLSDSTLPIKEWLASPRRALASMLRAASGRP